MPDYTRNWSDAIPPGSRSANEIDNSIRELRVDIHERMDDITTGWDNDPVQISATGAGGIIGCSYEIAPAPEGNAFGSVPIVAVINLAISGTPPLGIASVDLNTIGSEVGLNLQAANLYQPPGMLLTVVANGQEDNSPSRSVHISEITRNLSENRLSLQMRYADGVIVSSRVRMAVLLPFTSI